jgi:hypothetical protein
MYPVHGHRNTKRVYNVILPWASTAVTTGSELTYQTAVRMSTNYTDVLGDIQQTNGSESALSLQHYGHTTATPKHAHTSYLHDGPAATGALNTRPQLKSVTKVWG